MSVLNRLLYSNFLSLLQLQYTLKLINRCKYSQVTNTIFHFKHGGGEMLSGCLGFFTRTIFKWATSVLQAIKKEVAG